MKKMLIFVLLIVFFGGTAFLPTGSTFYAPPSNHNFQDSGEAYRVGLPPPAKICKGDDVPIVVTYGRWGDLDKPLEFIAYTDAGKLTQDYWTLPAGGQILTISTSFTAKNLGKKELEISNVADPMSLVMNFEVIDCNYVLKLEASEKQKNDLVSWDMSMGGNAVLSVNDTEVSSNGGSYKLLFMGEIQDKDLSSGSKGLACELAGNSYGSGDINVVGSNVKGNLNLNVEFTETEFGQGVVFHCKDVNGQESVVSMFESQTVNPGNYIDLQPYFAKGVSSYKFQFGDSGSGIYTLLKRSKK